MKCHIQPIRAEHDNGSYYLVRRFWNDHTQEWGDVEYLREDGEWGNDGPRYMFRLMTYVDTMRATPLFADD